MAAASLEITIPQEKLRMIELKIATGEYRTPSDVVLDALSRLEDEHLELEDWLVQETARRCEEADRFPQQRVSVAEVQQVLREEAESIRQGR